MQNNKKLFIIIGIVALIIIAGLFVVRLKKNSDTTSWVSYTQNYYGIQLEHPKDWEIVDNLSPKSCCLFVVRYNIATSTTLNASGTPRETVTATERIKLQIGPYETKTYDPFKISTTTKVHLGNNDFYTGISNGITFYILKQSETNGIGIAIFSYPETPEDAKQTALQVISTIKLVPPTATSTATTSAKL